MLIIQVNEIWNLIRKSDGSLKIASSTRRYRNGIWAFVMAMQKHYSNYDTDVFTPLIQKWRKLQDWNIHSNSVILNDSEESEEQNKTNIAIRVIVDHVRSFAIADGQLPSNTGAGYVIPAYFTSCNTLRIYFWISKNLLSINW
jgi:alanyl-tRNA synthetase